MIAQSAGSATRSGRNGKQCTGAEEHQVPNERTENDSASSMNRAERHVNGRLFADGVGELAAPRIKKGDDV